jgi:hypothetical protein
MSPFFFLVHLQFCCHVCDGFSPIRDELQLLDAAYFHPRVLGVPARWKAVVVHNATGEVVDGDMHIVCASALQNEILLLKIAQWGNEVLLLAFSLDLRFDEFSHYIAHLVCLS